MLVTSGMVKSNSAEDADALIFQTCSIRNTAAQKTLTHIAQAKKTRDKSNPSQKICVIGCLSAEDRNYPELVGVDHILGTNELEALVEILTGSAISQNFGVGNSIIIAHGCENFCSYCIVPYVRGREHSRCVDEIIAEFENIKNCGEVIYLLGQNVNTYKCPRTGFGFVELLDKISSINGDFKINFMSSHPKDFTLELVNCIARNPKIERNIHLPMQSGCDKILELMNRGYTVSEYIAKIEMLREHVPGVRITTDMICGFPGETIEDFNQTIATFKQIGFNAAFIFPYSRRTGTVADKMPGQIEEKEKKRRTSELVDINRKILTKNKDV